MDTTELEKAHVEKLLDEGIALMKKYDAARAIVEEVAAMGDDFDFEGIESLIIQANEFLEKYPRENKDADAKG